MPTTPIRSLAILVYEEALQASYWMIEGDEPHARQRLEQLDAIQAATQPPRRWDGFPEPGFTLIDVLTLDTLQRMLIEDGDLITTASCDACLGDREG